MAESRQTEERIERPKRIPVSQSRDVLTVKMPEGKVGRWVSEARAGRLQKFLEGGWEFVTDAGLTVGEKKVDGSTSAGSTVCKIGDSDGTMLYLMAIDQELYDEDQLAKAKLIDKSEEAILANTVVDGFYGSFKTDVTKSGFDRFK